MWMSGRLPQPRMMALSPTNSTDLPNKRLIKSSCFWLGGFSAWCASLLRYLKSSKLSAYSSATLNAPANVWKVLRVLPIPLSDFMLYSASSQRSSSFLVTTRVLFSLVDISSYSSWSTLNHFRSLMVYSSVAFGAPMSIPLVRVTMVSISPRSVISDMLIPCSFLARSSGSYTCSNTLTLSSVLTLSFTPRSVSGFINRTAPVVSTKSITLA